MQNLEIITDDGEIITIQAYGYHHAGQRFYAEIQKGKKVKIVKGMILSIS